MKETVQQQIEILDELTELIGHTRHPLVWDLEDTQDLIEDLEDAYDQLTD